MLDKDNDNIITSSIPHHSNDEGNDTIDANENMQMLSACFILGFANVYTLGRLRMIAILWPFLSQKLEATCCICCLSYCTRIISIPWHQRLWHVSPHSFRKWHCRYSIDGDALGSDLINDI